MQRPGRLLLAASAIAAIAVISVTMVSAGASRDRPAPRPGVDGETAHALAACENDLGSSAKTTPIATAKLIVEFNATDNDVGVHGAFDDHGWKTLCVFDPTGRAVLAVGPQGQLLDLTMAGIFFESREPPGSEFSFADLKAAFPEGAYTVRAESFDGTTLAGSATFTHDVPAAPSITGPVIAQTPRETRRHPVPIHDLQIRWDRVTRSVEGTPITITGYEVIVTKEVDDDPNGFSRPTYDVHVPAGVHNLGVPARFLEPRTVYELEVLALEESGNQTISVGFFKTA